jgi:hypothetical protein
MLKSRTSWPQGNFGLAATLDNATILDETLVNWLRLTSQLYVSENDMVNKTTGNPISVSSFGDAGACIIVPIASLDQVQALFDANQIRYWVEEEVYFLDGKPGVVFVNIEPETNPVMVQRLLDSVP